MDAKKCWMPVWWLSVVLLCFSQGATAEVDMRQCRLDENIYVLTLDNTDQVAEEEAAMATLRRIYRERGSSPVWMGMDSWGQVEAYHAYTGSAAYLSRLALVVDPYTRNLSLILTSDHQTPGLSWVTDNLSFIDGKSNAGADFRCLEDRVHLRWQGRDLSSSVEYFDSSEGELVARVAPFTNPAGQSAVRLEVERLHFRYPRSGLSGMLGSAWQSWVRRRTPHPHTFTYDRQRQGGGGEGLVMSARSNAGYQLQDRQRLLVDAGRFEGSRDESWSQNFFSPGLPVTLSSVRAQLNHVRTLLRNESMLFAQSVLGAPALKSYIDAADRHLEQGLSDRQGSDVHLVNALQQLAELSSRLQLNQDLVGASGRALGAVTSKMRQVQQVTEQAEALLEKAAARVRAQAAGREKIRQQALEVQPVAASAPEALPSAELVPVELQDLQASSGGDEPVPEREEPDAAALDQCLMTAAGLEGIFTASVGDTHYGFDTGLEVRLLKDHWIMTLESTRTPWTIPGWQAYGTDYVIPAQHTWCRGSLFGVDYARDAMRLTVRGVYDNVNSRIYLASQWSLWNQPRVLGWMEAVTAGLLLPGGVLVGGALASALGSPAAAAAVAGPLGLSLAVMPLFPPEVHFAHIRFFSQKLAAWGLGESWYTGAVSLDYHSHFATLVPKSSLD